MRRGDGTECISAQIPRAGGGFLFENILATAGRQDRLSWKRQGNTRVCVSLLIEISLRGQSQFPLRLSEKSARCIDVLKRALFWPNSERSLFAHFLVYSYREIMKSRRETPSILPASLSNMSYFYIFRKKKSIAFINKYIALVFFVQISVKQIIRMKVFYNM